MCAPADDAERSVIQHELQLRRGVAQTARITPIHVRRRLKAVEAKRKAGPGPGGWRDSYIAG
eukprot:2658926-Lingulodinium_polyedra.AAC.1